MRTKRRNEGVCEAGLMKNLVSKSGNRGGRMIDGRVAESVVEDQSPASGCNHAVFWFLKK